VSKRFGIFFAAGCLLAAGLWSCAIFTAVRLAPNVEESWFEPVLAIKKQAAAGKTGKRLFYASGSSGLYGADTPTFQRVTGVPFVNLGTFGGLGLEAMCDDVLDVARSGDAVLLALENDLFAFEPFHEGLIRHTFRTYPEKLLGDGLVDLPAYLFSLRFTEIRDRWIYRTRSVRGQRISPRADAFVTTVNADGDQISNIGAPRPKGKSMASDSTLKPPTKEALQRLERNLKRLRKGGLTVFATAQPKLLTKDYDRIQVDEMRRAPVEVYRKNDVPFFKHSFCESIDEKMFFDSDNHLNREGAVRYSTEVAGLLMALPRFVEWKQ
jgi:hypothetical protein